MLKGNNSHDPTLHLTTLVVHVLIERPPPAAEITYCTFKTANRYITVYHKHVLIVSMLLTGDLSEE